MNKIATRKYFGGILIALLIIFLNSLYLCDAYWVIPSSIISGGNGTVYDDTSVRDSIITNKTETNNRADTNIENNYTLLINSIYNSNLSMMDWVRQQVFFNTEYNLTERLNDNYMNSSKTFGNCSVTNSCTSVYYYGGLSIKNVTNLAGESQCYGTDKVYGININNSGFYLNCSDDLSGVGGNIDNSSYQCSSTDKLSNVSIVNGNITGVCTPDQQGTGTAAVAVSNESWKIELDFMTGSASSFDPFLGTAISSGTIGAGVGDNLHPGVMGLRDSTTANGGYMIRTDITALKLSGGEKATFVFRQNTARVNLTYRLGFLDTSTFAAPVDGCYFQVQLNFTNLVPIDMIGVCVSNSVFTNTTTKITLSNAAWYTGTIQLNPTASVASFTLYDATYTQIWNENITSNIPNTVLTETGFGAIATQATTDAAADIIQLDYMKLQIMDRSQIIRQTYANNATIKLSQEFLTASASVFDPFLGTAVSTGTVNTISGEQYHPGIVSFNDSTTGGGGYRVMTDITYSALYGGETANFVWKHYDDDRSTDKYLLGWFDTTVITTQPTDGCYFLVNGTVPKNNETLKGICRSNNLQTITTTMYNLTSLQWYWGKIQLDATASVVNFSIFNATNITSNAITPLWSDTISSNIPNTVLRETGFGAFAGESTIDAAKPMVFIDYIGLMINRTGLWGR